MNKTLERSLWGAGLVVLMAWVTAIALGGIGKAEASAPSGLPATVATTSQSILGANAATTLFATSTCTARIITTTPTAPIMLTFSDYAGQTPTATLGAVQAASTTVAYDSGIYGCGLVKAYSWSAQTITITETR